MSENGEEIKVDVVQDLPQNVEQKPKRTILPPQDPDKVRADLEKAGLGSSEPHTFKVKNRLIGGNGKFINHIGKALEDDES